MKNYVEKDGYQYARVYYRDSNGKKQQIWRTVGSKSEVPDKVREIRNELDKGTESFENRDSLGEYLDRWIETMEGTVSDRTWGDYKDLLRLYVRPELGKKKLSSIKPMDVQGVLSAMSKRGLSPRTVQYTHTVLRHALKDAVMPFQLITFNPARDVKLPKRVKRQVKSLSPETALKFLDECAKDKHGLLFEFAIVTGMRPGEYLALRWSDVDLKGNKVLIQQALVRHRKGGGFHFGPPKTDKSRRTIPIPPYLKRQLAEAKMKQETGAWDLVFANEEGNPLSLRNLQRRHFKPILERAGLSVTTYGLRHSCATLLMAAGENPKVVAERLGHSSVTLTLDVYSHVSPTMQQEATNKLEKMLRRRKTKRG
jgi:integrase